jgi:adenosylcobinamide-GDP ribazoletransferase
MFFAAAATISPLLALVIWREPVAACGIAVVILAFVLWLRRLLLRRLGGTTGDCLGFAAYFGIIAVSIGLAR